MAGCSPLLQWVAVECLVRILLVTAYLLSKLVKPIVNVFLNPITLLYSYPYMEHQTITKCKLFMLALGVYLALALHCFGITVARYRRRTSAAKGLEVRAEEPVQRKRWLTPLKKVLFEEQLRLFFALSLALSLAGVTVMFMKLTSGRLRPDFISRCANHFKIPMSNVVVADCLQENDPIINDGHMSFPSGHTTLAFCVMGFASIYLIHQGARLIAHAYRVVVYVIALLLFLPAIYCGITRVTDYRHHWDDVVAGGIVGLVYAVCAYCYYYGSPFTGENHFALPYLPRPGDARHSAVLIDAGMVCGGGSSSSDVRGSASLRESRSASRVAGGDFGTPTPEP